MHQGTYSKFSPARRHDLSRWVEAVDRMGRARWATTDGTGTCAAARVAVSPAVMRAFENT